MQTALLKSKFPSLGLTLGMLTLVSSLSHADLLNNPKAPFLPKEYTSGELTQTYLNGEEAQREDEFATSEARKDYLEDRLCIQLGAGSKFGALGDIGISGPPAGASPIAWGAALEYITQWHFAPFFAYGIVPKSTDEEQAGVKYDMPYIPLTRYGLTYYFFPKSPLHAGISASYGTTYYAHKALANSDKIREVIQNKGWNFEGTVTYLSDAWYIITLHVGLSSSDKRLPGSENNSYNESSVTGKNPRAYSSYVNTDKPIAGRTVADGSQAYGIPDNNLSIGAGLGIALPNLFPDKTERRYRERQKAREKLQ